MPYADPPQSKGFPKRRGEGAREDGNDGHGRMKMTAQGKGTQRRGPKPPAVFFLSRMLNGCRSRRSRIRKHRPSRRDPAARRTLP